MAGFDNDVLYADNVDFTGGSPVTGKVTANGQLMIGAATAPYIRVATLTNGNNVSFTNGPGSITGNLTGTTEYAVQVGSAAGALSSVGPSSTAGQIFQSGGPSSNPSYSTATYPSTAGTSGNVLTSDGTNFVSSTPGSPSSTAGAVLDMVDDFIAKDDTNVIWSNYYWSFTGSLLPSYTYASTRTGVFRNNGANPGIILGGNTGLGYMSIGGAGEITLQWYARVGVLSDVTNRYNYCIGLINRISGAPQAGLYFQYNDSVNSGNWQIINNSADGTPTTGNTNTAADTNWHVFKIVVNAAATSVSYFIDGTQVSGSPLTTDIPASTIGLSPGISVIATAGTVQANTLWFDLFTMKQVFTTSRG